MKDDLVVSICEKLYEDRGSLGENVIGIVIVLVKIN